MDSGVRLSSEMDKHFIAFVVFWKLHLLGMMIICGEPNTWSKITFLLITLPRLMFNIYFQTHAQSILNIL